MIQRLQIAIRVPRRDSAPWIPRRVEGENIMLYGIPQPFPNAVEDIIADATERYPTEACGFIIDGEYVPKRNISDEPTKTFQIHKKAYIAAERKGGLDDVGQSHPDGDKCPTQLEMEKQVEPA